MAVVLNDLYDYGLKIYQESNGFKFSLDSLLLSEFVEIKKSDKNLLDMCCGNAPLSLIIAKNNNIKITSVEIQKNIALLAKKSIEYNHFEDKITIINDNVKKLKDKYPPKSFDIIACNPPFFKVSNTSYKNIEKEKAIARHELTITLKEIISLASYLLKDNGTFYLVHRPNRLEEIIEFSRNEKFHIKRMELISKDNNSEAIMVLLKMTKNGNYGLKLSSKIINRNTKTYQNIFKG